jgi:hypothetical protein
MDTNNFVLNRLFTQYIFSDLVKNYHNNIYLSVIKRFINNPEHKNNKTIISEIYEIMVDKYRNEYIYKNTLLNILLLKKHNVFSTTALTEIPIGKSKADFILINGKAVVYEIKTELDKFDRLENQIIDYYKVFPNVCLVTSIRNINKIQRLKINDNVGIYFLDANNDLIVKKEPVECYLNISSSALFKILHKKEFENIILDFYKKLPQVSQVKYYDECCKWFSEIPIYDAYELTIGELRRRSTILVEDYQKIPSELKFLVYFSNYSKGDYSKLNNFLLEKYGG